MSTETPKIPLREQPYAHKPRIIVRDGKFRIEYLGLVTKSECLRVQPTFENAIASAREIARFQASILREEAA